MPFECVNEQLLNNPTNFIYVDDFCNCLNISNILLGHVGLCPYQFTLIRANQSTEGIEGKHFKGYGVICHLYL